MNIFELESFNLADAVKFHSRLNHRLWDRSEHLHPEVKERLLAVARDFQEFLGVPDLDVKDITVSGSNAAYNYTDNSDIDLHLVVDIPDVKHGEVYRELFNAKKYQYNDQHNIRIGGADVELYAQPSDQPHHSQGIYSLLRNAWVQVPRRKRAHIDDSCVRAKFEDLSARIDDAIESGDGSRMRDLQRKMKTLRQTGLEQQGEFGCDNLVFKMLRARGYIQRLVTARNRAHAAALSLAEKNTVRAPVVYGFVKESPDGVDPSTKMFLETKHQYADVVQDFIHDTATRLGIENMPEIQLHDDPAWSREKHSFGMYEPEQHVLHVNLHNRHLLDILRTTAHELCHCRQHEVEPLGPDAGDTGSDFENEAHAVAGIIMRDYADAHPETFANEPMDETGGYASYFKTPADNKKPEQGRIFNAPQEYYAWQQKQKQQPNKKPAPVKESSGYIPTEAERNDPRFEMALSVDVQPGATGLNANRMSLKTDAQGRPQMLRADGKVNMVEYRMPQPSRGPNNNKDLNAPLGPETPPKMPDGTIKVDVSDMYDWYKLGQKISDLKSIDKSDLGVGPPSTVFAFGSEDLENMYSHELTKLGLKTHDLDEPGEEDVDEGVKSGLAKAALAGSMALGAGGANAMDWKDAAMTGAMFVPGIGPAVKAYNVGKSLYQAGTAAKQYRDLDKELAALVAQNKAQNPSGPTTVAYDPNNADEFEPVDENFADGRNPQDKGDSKRYGVPTKASVSTLRRVAKQGGRKGQLAHWMANMKAGRAKAKRKNESIAEVRINNASGVGAVPYNAEIDYHGLQVAMRPSMFLKLALPLDAKDPEERKAIDYCKSEMNEKGFGAPFLTISVPEAWEQGDFSLEAKVKGHDGRHRCYAILEKEGDDPIEVHIIIPYFKRRDITPEIIENLRNGILNQNGRFTAGPLFGEAK